MLCAVAFSAVIASLTYSLALDHHAAQRFDSDKLAKMRLGAFKGSTPARLIERIGGSHTPCDSADSCIKDLLSKKTDGFMYDEAFLNYLSETRYRGKISVYPTHLKPYWRAFAMPKNSAMRKPFNVALLKIMERPIGEALIKQLDLGAYTRPKQALPTEEGSRRPGRRKK